MNPAPPVTKTRSPIRRSLRIGLLAPALAATLLTGCGGGGSSTATPPRRAAEPAEAPPLAAAPAGRVAPVGNEPEGVAWDVDAGLLAVGVRDPAAVAFVDPRTLRVVRRVPLPAPPRHLAYDPAAGTVLVPAEGADELLAVRPRGVVSATKVGRHPHDAASVGADVFVADEHSDQVSALRKGRLVRTLPAPHQPGGIAEVSGRWVALVAVSARVLQIYGVSSLKPVARLPAGVGPSHIVAAAGLAYVADTQGNRILVYEIGRRTTLLGHVAAPGTPYGLALDPNRGRLWVTETATNRLAEYSTVSELPRLVATFSTLRQPNSVAVDERSGDVFVAGRDAGRIERIAPSRKGNR